MNTFRYQFWSIVILLTLSGFLNAQERPLVFVAEMEGGFDSFITAAMIKKGVPLDITKEESSADYIIAGGAVKGNNKWYDTVFGVEKDRNQGSIQLIRVRDKVVEFAANAGDKSRWFTGWKKGGQEKVANRLAKKLKEHFDDKAKGKANK